MRILLDGLEAEEVDVSCSAVRRVALTDTFFATTTILMEAVKAGAGRETAPLL